MKNLKVTFFFLAVALTLSGCGLFGGSDGTDVSIAEGVEAQPTVNNVQAVPAQTPDGTTADDAGAQAEATPAANAALPTAVTLPTAAPTPEPTVDRSQPTTYIVQSGDVLGLIAERFDADIAELRRVNSLDGNLIRVGQELTIPALDGSTTTETTESADASPGATAAPAATSAPAATVSCSGSTANGHCIQPGESLLGIALKYDITEEALRAANPGISGDLIKSGEVINLPGGSAPAPAATSAPVAPAGTSTPVATVGPINNADCAARNPEFPFFHAADGLCYANPIDGSGGTPTATTIPGSDPNQECAAGFFLWDDGLCYPIPGVTVTPDANTTPTATVGIVAQDFGRPPCRDGYVVLVTTNKCWPEATNTSPATVTPAATTATTTAGTQTTCDGVNFTRDATGKCFLTQEGADAGCSIENGSTPFCP